jgi:CRP-like cAMP-binding protein
MARISLSRSNKAVRKSAARGVNGQPIHNTILLALPKKECHALFSKLEFVSLPTRAVLNEAGKPILFAFFLNDGLVSILSIMGDGKTVEVGLCGKEGFVGIPLIAGFSSRHTRAITLVASSAFRVAAEDLIAALPACPKLATALQRFAQEMALQSSQIAACNRLHEVDERMARWLLMSQDRLEWRFCAADARVPRPHAGHTQGQRYRGCRHPAKSRTHQLYARSREN